MISGCLAPASRAALAAFPIAIVEAKAPQEIAIAAPRAAIPLVSNAAMTGKAAKRMVFIYLPPKIIISIKLPHYAAAVLAFFALSINRFSCSATRLSLSSSTSTPNFSTGNFGIIFLVSLKYNFFEG